MKAIVKRVVFTDEWIESSLQQRNWLITTARNVASWVIPPRPRRIYEFKNYALGFRWEPDPRELELIQRMDLFQHQALKLRDGDRPFTFAEILGVELIPEINPSQIELLRIEGKIKEAALMWQHSFASMAD